ncbi:Transcriptional regulatory protein [Salix suchowensis]|nr:Transcriptional regulatory protein [Salix suchowensis]
MKDSTDAPDDPNNLDITLPPGWGKKNSVKDKTIIVTLPLVLAFVICFLIIGCLFWRKSRAKKYREHDIEMKALQLRRNEEDNESIVIQAALTKQKLWARATARWKANARYTARQRRANAPLPLAALHLTVLQYHSPTQSTITNLPIATLPLPRENAEAPVSISVSPPSPAPASPPAYHQPLRQLSVDNLGSAGALSQRQSFKVSAFPPHPPDSVADDTLGDSFSSSYYSSGFPLPPLAVSLKGKEADLSYYEYEYSYDDIADVEPEIGPSAPPFVEFPALSAPPLDDSFFGEHAGPSAPPFPVDEDDHAVEQHSDRSMFSDSMGDALEYVDEEEFLVAVHAFGTTLTPSQDLATTASNEPQPSPPSPLNHSTSDYPRHRASPIESAQDSVANDCIPLPRYQP